MIAGLVDYPEPRYHETYKWANSHYGQRNRTIKEESKRILKIHIK